jgi:The GLUG motif
MLVRNSLVSAGIALIVSLLCPADLACADVVISSGATANMSCSGGMCAPTATNAVLNVTDLENLLASGNVTVTTTGSGVQANNIHVKATLSPQNMNTLNLDAYQSIRIERHIAVEGSGGVSIATNDGGTGGTLSFGSEGRVSFANVSSPLSINGASYTLVKSIASLASALAANPNGDYALADNYDASQDGTYSGTPINTTVSGIVEGLGNAISNVTVVTTREQLVGGLFHTIDFESTVENLGLDGLKLKMGTFRGGTMGAGGFALVNDGLLFDDHVSGSISMDSHKTESGSLVGGLVGQNDWNIVDCYSSANVYTDGGSPGGLVGFSDFGSISGSYATGTVTIVYEANFGYAGGLIASNQGSIDTSYATGPVTGEGEAPDVGGLIGVNVATSDTVSTSYSTGQVTKGTFGAAGGFVGVVDAGGFSDCYWDINTSGQSSGAGGGNISGVTGLSSKKLRSGLPQGFDSTVWKEKKSVNNGFPYLVANPPPS